jgi:hypothetical protein
LPDREAGTPDAGVALRHGAVLCAGDRETEEEREECELDR